MVLATVGMHGDPGTSCLQLSYMNELGPLRVYQIFTSFLHLPTLFSLLNQQHLVA
jgi:hypothetical protein